ncbi:DNA topoisomerase III [Phocaeicola massiliensis]|uniref:DNA topoisomerase n=1 Tax=Phocaeicola massiliensis TaxID=204516 RepID=UPI001C032214|nr:DNA topoisomerase [Phocaeicola massiliensis]MBT9894018.1 DNA topoisomerase III [Phocaeicola massiliensis]
MIAILTDRPNVGKEIARIVGAHRFEKGYMTGNGYAVTWTFGNMLSLAMPKDYGNAKLERKDFPLVPGDFRLMVKHVRTDEGWIPDISAVMQLKTVEKVLAECDTIIAATEASREGEMTFRYLYRYLGCRQPVQRLWLSSLTDEAVRKGMTNLLPVRMFDRMFLASDSRNKADWLLGMNASYALCKATGLGNHSLGRVQTPVLAAVSSRYRERENHIGADSWPVYISMHKDGTLLKMRCTDEFSDRETALMFYNDCKYAEQARITSVHRQQKEVSPPAPYNLTGLQKDASCLYGLTAGQTADIAQGLYEKKLISYPRTDGHHIAREVYDTLPAVMEKVLPWSGIRPGARLTDTMLLPEQLSGNDSLAEHPAITVTGVRPEGLGRQEMQVYTLIAGRLLEAFMPPCRVECTTVEAVCAARTFRIRTCRILDKGWHAVFERGNAVLPQGFTWQELPALSAGDTLPVSACNLVRRKDLPASPFTDAELIEYMDTAGLGTPATRAGIIQTLIERKYIRYSGRYIIPTRKGLFIYETIRGTGIADAALTTGWEARLARMERGKLTQNVFLREVADLAQKVTDEIFQACKPRK